MDNSSTSTTTNPAGVFVNTACVPTPNPHKPKEFVDHYKVLGLDNWATSEEVKAKHRELRGEYFRNCPVKYRALQDAYTVLVDRQARCQYDAVYRARFGLPGPPPPPPQSPRSSSPSRSTADFIKKTDDRDRVRTQDPNWALKHPNPVYKPLIGSRPYWSYVPVPEGYGLPQYIGDFARNARPV